MSFQLRCTNYQYALHKISLEININRDLKIFWSLLGNKSKNQGIPTEVSKNNKSISNAQGISNAFAHFFSVYEEQYKLDTETVRSSSSKLKPKKTLETDSVFSYIFKGCIDIFLKPLSQIFNPSFNI